MENYASSKICRDLSPISDATASSSENYIFQKSLTSFFHDAAARRKFVHLFVSPPLHFAEVYVLERVELTLSSSEFFYFTFCPFPAHFSGRKNAKYFFVIEVMSRYCKENRTNNYYILMYIYI